MKRYYTGIDIGTYHIKVVIAESVQGVGLRIAGTGSSISKGMRQGYIVSGKDATHAIQEALHAAETAAGTKVRSAYLAIGGIGLDEMRSTGEVTLTTSGGNVTPRDVDRAIQRVHAARQAKHRAVCNA